MVFGLVELADRGIDADLPEQRLHTERARLVRDDRHDTRSKLLVLEELRKKLHERHRRGLVALDAPSDGTGSFSLFVVLAGTKPPSAWRRSRRY